MIRSLLARLAFPEVRQLRVDRMRLLARALTAETDAQQTRAELARARADHARAARICHLLADREQAAREEVYALRDRAGYGHLQGRGDAHLQPREGYTPVLDIITRKGQPTP